MVRLLLIGSLLSSFILMHTVTPASGQSAGSLSGTVVDASTNEPLPAANVYLTYTTLGTSTDSAGHFQLSGIPGGTYELAVSMLGFVSKTMEVEVSDRALNGLSFELQPVVYELDVVEITDNRPRSWERDFQRFRELFMGESPFTDDVEILNPFVLDFEREAGADVFSATAAEPLLIVNRALGYEITFELQQFEWDPHQMRLIQVGLPRFRVLAPSNEEERVQWEENRQYAWSGSLPHLFRSMIQGTSFDEGFQLTQYSQTFNKRVQGKDLLVPDLTDHTYLLEMEGLLDVRAVSTRGKGFLRRKTIEHNYQIEIQGSRLVVNADGYWSPARNLHTRGYTRRIAELLPREYGRQFLSVETSRIDVEERVELMPLRRTSLMLAEAPGSESLSPNTAPGEATGLIRRKQWKEAIALLHGTLKDTPDNREALYYRAISHREIARSLPYLDEDYVDKKTPDNWSRASDDFDRLLNLDPSFRDASYQYAVLKQYMQKYQEAIALGKQQLDTRPGLAHVRAGLFDIYESYLYDDFKHASAWLADQEDEMGRYYQARALRLEGKPEAALNILRELTAESLEIPLLPVYLSMARCHYALNEKETAEAFIRRAIASVATRQQSNYLFDLFMYIATPEEWSTYQNLETATEYRDFFTRFWDRRDPLASLPWNERMAVHFDRLSYAEEHFIFNERRIWNTDADINKYLQAPTTYPLNELFNDKGVVYIRHGEPVDKVVQIGASSTLNGIQLTGPTAYQLDLPDDMLPFRTSPNDSTTLETTAATGLQQQGYKPNESWRYNDPDLDFHFVLEGGGSNWRLAPVFPMTESAIEQRAHWGGVYSDMALEARDQAQGSPLARPLVFSQRYIEDKSRTYIQTGLTTDRHSWSSDVEGFEYPFLVSTFRGEDGGTRIDVDYALPLGLFTRSRTHTTGDIAIEQGCLLQDDLLAEIGKGLTVQSVRPSLDDTAPIVGSCQFTARPDSYRVSIHSRPISTNLLGGYSFSTVLPDYSTPVLHMSDLLPAELITPASTPSRFNRNDHYVRPNPFLRFSTRTPLYLYFELYNLTLNENDQATYSIQYQLIQPRRERGLFKGNDEPVLTLQFQQESVTTNTVEMPRIDVSSVKPGQYRLVVRVSDIQTEATVERSLDITLIR